MARPSILGALLAGMLLGQLTGADEPKTDAGLREWGRRMVDQITDGHVPTMGGRQFWGDVLHFRGWRIQQNVISDHYRLLDPGDFRYASGTKAECLQKLERIKKERELAPLEGRAVILIHGMGRSSKSLSKIAGRLRGQGAIVVGFDYPSTQCGIAESAEYLNQVIENLDGITEIDIVCHSMGGLLVRAWLAEHEDERIDRMVMLAVPNQGAEMADILDGVPLYEWIYGPGGGQLGTNPKGFIADLPTPEFEFAIIAAGRGTDGGYNPFIPGDDDGTVTVASTRLPGASDFLQVNGVLHSFIMDDQRVIEAALRYLQTGHLRGNGERHPIEAEQGDEEQESEEELSIE